MMPLQMPFIANKGQVSSGVAFYAVSARSSVFVHRRGDITYAFIDSQKGRISLRETFKKAAQADSVHQTFLHPRGLAKSPVRINTYMDSDKSPQLSALPAYRSVSIGDISEGIDLRLSVRDDNVEKTFHIAPGADPGKIVGSFEGIRQMYVNRCGELEINAGETKSRIRFTVPVAWQPHLDGNREPVEVAYRMVGPNSYGFALGNYDARLPLVIDPLLAGTFVSSGSEVDFAMAQDGSVYVAVLNRFGDAPATDDTDWVHGNLIVSRFSSDLSTLISATFLGKASDVNLETAIAPDGSIYIAGSTDTNTYPTTTNAYETNLKDTQFGWYVFVTRLSADLSTLLGSTFISSIKSYDRVAELKIAADGTVLIAGNTHSPRFPITGQAYDAVFVGDSCEIDYPGMGYVPPCSEGFICRMSADLSTLLAGTYLGGSGEDMLETLCIGQDQSLYAAGSTRSNDFPMQGTTFGNTQSPAGSNLRAFAVQLKEDLSQILGGSFIAGSWDVEANDILVVSDGILYLAGQTSSSDFPVSTGALNTQFVDGYSNAFVCRLEENMSSMPASTFIKPGNSPHLAGGPDGNIYVAFGNPRGPALSQEAYNPFPASVFIAKVSGGLSAMLAKTYFGSTSGSTELDEMQVDADHQLVLAGVTGASVDFPVTSNAYKKADDIRVGGDQAYNIFLSKLDADLSAAPDRMYPQGTSVMPDLKIGALIDTEEEGLIEAVWQEGGREMTERGDQVIWGYFHADPEDVSWGSVQNPDVYVKIWFDVNGRIYVNYTHFSVPDIYVYSNYPAGQMYTLDGHLTMVQRYVQHYYHQQYTDSYNATAEIFPEYPTGGSQPAGNPVGYATLGDLHIGAVIQTEPNGPHGGERVPIEARWRLGGQDTTARGDQVMWGFFYADPEDVSWGSRENPDLFVKIWFDAGGRIDVNFFHVSVPDIEVYSDYPGDGNYGQAGTTTKYDRYIRHEYQQ
jgi:hypothetical protein